MTFAIELALTPRPLERAEGEIAVVGFFTDERPLRGGAARAETGGYAAGSRAGSRMAIFPVRAERHC